MAHRHYTDSWRRCRDCGRIANDWGDYCDDCSDRLDAENEAQQRLDEAEAATLDQAADAALREASCTCSTSFVPSNAHSPPERILDRRCPLHGDGGPDPDRAYEDWRDAQIERDCNSDISYNGD